jgi:hypothetical protein
MESEGGHRVRMLVETLASQSIAPQPQGSCFVKRPEWSRNRSSRLPSKPSSGFSAGDRLHAPIMAAFLSRPSRCRSYCTTSVKVVVWLKEPLVAVRVTL